MTARIPQTSRIAVPTRRLRSSPRDGASRRWIKGTAIESATTLVVALDITIRRTGDAALFTSEMLISRRGVVCVKESSKTHIR
jgi:hypothetical protein